ncbi:DUF2750 domain-containing protein [Asticcacaulis sp. YBE204]|uniref:DUF2750 domain-containing protein n=1 Tax=Asticcacaulis sp. YBE204 TaxID=1282363 RepID=UPI0009DD9721|nr:DUF2750 domain-containing protein [Asticcacaulis sp. YBE204]
MPSQSAAQAHQFFLDVAKSNTVWTIRDKGGFPTSTNLSGETAMPFWSTENRAKIVIANVEAYQGFSPHQLTLPEFQDRWLPGMEADGLKVGLNWTGKCATGYDLTPSEVQERLQYAVK